MKAVLSPAEMAACDSATSEIHQIPSLVLMERAALMMHSHITSAFSTNTKISIVCGFGNNGGDGLALARLLYHSGYNIKYIVIGAPEKYTSQVVTQLASIKSYGLFPVQSLTELSDCDVIVDALFGIGLSRPLKGEFAQAVSFINSCKAYTIACDIPSGLSGKNGQILRAEANTSNPPDTIENFSPQDLSCVVKADLTLTMAYIKKGLLLGDGPDFCGKIEVCDVGIYLSNPKTFAQLVEKTDLSEIPGRKRKSNKGTCGKIVIIAGSKEIYGACYLSAKAASRTGSGLVKVYTDPVNIPVMQSNLPEAMYTSYTKFESDKLDELIRWADAILIGPGIGTGDIANQITGYVLTHSNKPLVIDADAINIISQKPELLSLANCPIILTPHLKEMSRLCQKSVAEIDSSMEETALEFSDKFHCSIVLKNHTTVVANPSKQCYYITSGNQALATAGSGDVLSGITVSLLGLGLSPEKAAYLGAYMHGAAGTSASKKTGIKGLLASDIIDFIEDTQ